MNIHEIQKELEISQIIDILAEAGIEMKGETSEVVKFSTAYRGGDSDKLWLYKNSNGFVDYAGAGTISLCDILSVSRGEEVEEGFKESCRSILAFIGINRRKGVLTQRSTSELEEPVDTYKFQLCPNDEYNDIMSYYWDIPCEAWLEEGIGKEVQKKFGIKWDWTKGSAIIPVRNIEGGLDGVIERNFDPELLDKGFKYMPVNFQGKFLNYPLAYSFYGLYENQEAIRKTRSVIIVEGEKSVLKAAEWFGENSTVLAIKGMKTLSRWQVDMLKHLGVMKVCLCLDKDFVSDDGSEGARRFFEKRKKIYEETAKLFPIVTCREGLDSDVGAHENVFDHDLETFERSKEIRIR